MIILVFFDIYVYVFLDKMAGVIKRMFETVIVEVAEVRIEKFMIVMVVVVVIKNRYEKKIYTYFLRNIVLRIFALI